MTQTYNVLDLFSGAGGMSEGFLRAGFNIPLATDYSQEAAQTYINRHKQLGYSNLRFFNGDIRTLSSRDTFNDFASDTKISVVIGGPPCQGFSLSGKRDKSDERNTLFLEYLRVVSLSNPDYFVMENVEGILSYRINKIIGLFNDEYNNELVTDIILSESEKLGYKVKFKLLNAKDYGVPQNRPRVIFLGYRAKKIRDVFYPLVPEPQFPKAQNTIITVSDAISDLRFLKMGENKETYDNRYKKTEYQKKLISGLTPNINGDTIPSTKLSNHVASRHKKNTLERFSLLKPGEGIEGLLERLTTDEYEKHFTKKYRCFKLHQNQVSPTVLTLPDDIIHYDLKNPRILSVRELARIQSFDDSFQFVGNRTTGGDRRKFETPQYTQVGNAVPPIFAYSIAKEIMKALKQIEKAEKTNLINYNETLALQY
ncbi:DNA cytosine methyltransferase [Paenibacillus sp. FSL W8-0426]|uniref:DNA cytosine methyltransferase n=1 Tax=Paenibacillus sp. FSL W8-0426 TaxID=2921714 RepID=UPI0030DB86BA